VTRGGGRDGALRALGYTQAEAEFLRLAAAHSGYFLRRQLCRFASSGPAGPGAGFLGRLLERGHAREVQASRATRVYHLRSVPFWEAAGARGHPHRRRRPRFAVRAKLMALDYVIAHPGRYLETEAEKVDYFHVRRGVGLDLLPAHVYSAGRAAGQIRRYFVEKFPISVSEAGPETAPVAFTYIDEGGISTPSFATFLARYALLFAALGRVRVVFVALRERRGIEAERTFRRFSERAFPAGRRERRTAWLELGSLRAEFGAPGAFAPAPEFSSCLLAEDYGFLETVRARSGRPAPAQSKGGPMALIPKRQVPRPKRKVGLRLDADAAEMLGQYCRFIESGPSYVVESLLLVAMKRDRSFREWLEGATPSGAQSRERSGARQPSGQAVDPEGGPGCAAS